MIKQVLVGLGIVLAVSVAIIAGVPAWRMAALGYLNNERFYRGKPASYWSQALKSTAQPPPPELAALKEGGAEAVPVLIDLLKAPDPAVRGKAAQVLGSIGPEAAPAVPALSEALHDPDRDVRCRAARPWVTLAPRRAAVPSLIEALKDEEPVRLDAIRALGRIGPDARPALPALLDVLVKEDEIIKKTLDKDRSVGPVTVHALSQIVPVDRMSVPALIEALKDEHPFVRQHAGPHPRPEGPGAAGRRLGPGRGFAGQGGRRALDAVLALGRFGSVSQGAAPALVQALQDNNHLVRGASAMALHQVGADPKVAVPALIGALGDKVVLVRVSAIEALAEIGKGDQEVVPALAEMLKADNDAVRYAATRALGTLGSEARSATPSLLAALKDKEGAVRASAAVGPGPRRGRPQDAGAGPGRGAQGRRWRGPLRGGPGPGDARRRAKAGGAGPDRAAQGSQRPGPGADGRGLDPVSGGSPFRRPGAAGGPQGQGPGRSRRCALGCPGSAPTPGSWCRRWSRH